MGEFGSRWISVMKMSPAALGTGIDMTIEQTLGSPAHDHPPSTMHVPLQPSPPVLSPSSQVSVPTIMPSPHTGPAPVHPVVIQPSHVPLQASRPPAKPTVVQSLPFRSVPSQSSAPLATPSPHTAVVPVHRLVSKSSHVPLQRNMPPVN